MHTAPQFGIKWVIFGFAIPLIFFWTAFPVGADSQPASVAGGMTVISIPEMSSITLHGDSTLHRFFATAKSLNLEGLATRDAAVPLPWVPKILNLSLPVKNLTSGFRYFDGHLHEKLKIEEDPLILLHLDSFDLGGLKKGAQGTTGNVIARGTITVAGVKMPIELQASVDVSGQMIHVRGTRSFLMSEFGITPPVFLFGILKAQDQVEVDYDAVFKELLKP